MQQLLPDKTILPVGIPEFKDRGFNPDQDLFPEVKFLPGRQIRRALIITALIGGKESILRNTLQENY